ncbi:MAG: efflux RND transporter periplasmic adaptor subunit, partial [Acidobacteria bacterium]
ELDRARADARLKKITYERLQSVRQEEPDVLSQQRVDEARAAFDVAQAMVAVAESQIAVAESEVARAEANRARLTKLMEYARIRAPFNGVVTKRYVDPGALIQRALSQKDVSPIVTIARTDRLRLVIDVAESDVPYARPGRSVTFTVDALPDRVFKGTLTRVARALDPKTRTMRAEIDVANHKGVLHPGMYAHVTLVLERRKGVLTVPAEALLIEGGRTSVYTVRDGRARRIIVERGLDDGIRVEIIGGLTERDPVIIGGHQAVHDGTPVTITHS